MEDQADHKKEADIKLADFLKSREEIIRRAALWSKESPNEIKKILSLCNADIIERVANVIYWNDVSNSKLPLMSTKGVVRDVYEGITGEKFKPRQNVGSPCPACGGAVYATSAQKLTDASQEESRSFSRNLALADMCCLDCYHLELEHAHRPGNVMLYPNPSIHELVKMEYSAFLKTDYWLAVRDFIKNRDNGECVLCGSMEGLHVHHKKYRHRGYEFKSDLHTLCANCHAKFHGKETK